jgi:hypothetical protein
MKHIVYVLVLAATLSGCADKPSKDAVIEDRGLRTQPAAGAAGAMDTQGVATAPMDSKDISGGASGTGGTSAAATGPKQEGALETRPLAEAPTDVKPLSD